MQVKITDNTDAFKKAKEEAVLRALEAVGLTAERHAKERCPVDTGLLRNSITHAVSGQTVKKTYQADRGIGSGSYNGSIGSPDENAVYIGTNVEYGKYVETGDSAHHPSGAAHFLRDAAAGHLDEYKRIITEQLKKA